ncbi:HAD-IA family hydrolase [Microbacterium sp. NPDC076911]|uniref:HAD-IA family hydrolase n=1 Tax=Microbacterium sp. NPDC076911 TaxID=3154958 RepID=UPI00341F277C
MQISTVIAVAGVAGSGKSTLGRAIATQLSSPLIDLDHVSNPLLDALPVEALGGEHWISSPFAPQIREGRYAALRAVVADAVSTTQSAVVVAPFTAELTGGHEWDLLREAVAPARLIVVNMVGDPQLLAARRHQRGAERDSHRTDVGASLPAIDVVCVDAELATEQQVSRVLAAAGVRLPIDEAAPLFTADFDAVLFDLDGTLVDSTASVIRSWRRFAEHYGVSMQALHANHGQPARTLVGKLLPRELHDEALAYVTRLEVTDAAGLAPVQGALSFFESVPATQRAIVTSGSVPIAHARLAAAGFAHPDVFVTVDDVTRGKPDPEPFLLAAQRLGVAPERCLVVEDANAGITAARAAGCHVLAIAGTVDAEELDAEVVVDGLDRVEIVRSGDALRLRPSGASGRT